MSSPILQIYCLLLAPDEQLNQAITRFLPTDRYSIKPISSIKTFAEIWIKQQTVADCLIICGTSDVIRQQIAELEQLSICLPTVTITTNVFEQEPSDAQITTSTKTNAQSTYIASINISSEQLSSLSVSVDQAIVKFLELLPKSQYQVAVSISQRGAFDSLSSQQQRLSQKLQERLGYLGVYYKRDPKLFIKHLSEEDRQIYLARLKAIYSTIVLEYFKDKPDNLNQKIDEFVNLAFFGDVSISQVLEIHISLMDEFSKQLKLEGRNEEILLDYRITLIDIIAHLCELYRRSIPREA